MFEFIFDAMFVIVPIIILITITLTVLSIASPKFRGKFMGRQIKAAKYMLEDVKDDLADMGGIVIDTKKKIIDENEDNLRDLSTKTANIHKDGITTTVKAIKDGIVGNTVYCKHCGSVIDADSKFCKSCGKEQ